MTIHRHSFCRKKKQQKNKEEIIKRGMKCGKIGFFLDLNFYLDNKCEVPDLSRR